MVDKISELKEGKSVTIRGRVLEVGEVRTVQTRYGPKQLSEAVVGDETGKVKVTLWDEKAGTLKEGEFVEIRDGWTTSFRGEVKVNANRRTEIEVLDEGPSEEEIPDKWPKAEGSSDYPRRGFRGRRGGFQRSNRKEF